METTRGEGSPADVHGPGSVMITARSPQDSDAQLITGIEKGTDASPFPESGEKPQQQSPALAADASALAPQPFVTPQTPIVPEPFEEEPSCMYVQNCDTGSQLRKAISHFFGRNKSCTLRIPKQVWVYYCRKHYQRIRYRNASSYPLNQMELVVLQIRRLQTWSEGNQQRGSGPYIKLWTLSLRKREQNRLDMEASATEAGDEEDPTAQIGAAPKWLIERLGTGYTTEQMLDVAKTLYKEIANGTLTQVPEIEFLPDITDPDEGSSTKPLRSRKQNKTTAATKATKRKASEMTNAQGSVDDGPFSTWDERFGPMEKQRRVGDVGRDHPLQRSSNLSTPSANMPAAYGDGHSTLSTVGLRPSPPRAPMVPRMQALDYTQSSGVYGHSSNDYTRTTEPFNGTYGQCQPASATYYHQSSVDSAQSSSRWNQGYDGHPRLPSISAQMPDDSGFHTPLLSRQLYGAHGINGNSQSYLRPLHHHRSSSAYTPTSRPGPALTRPASAGNGTQAGLPPFDTRTAAGPSVYDVGTQSFSREAWHEPEYSYTPSWGHGYNHGFAPQQQQQQQQQQVYQHASPYDQALRHRIDNVSTRFAATEYGSHGSEAWHRVNHGTDRVTEDLRGK